MWRHGRLLAALAALAVLAPPASARPVRPEAFASCADLVGYGRRHLAATHGVAQPMVQPLPLPVAAPPAQNEGAVAPVAAPTTDASTVSTTNNQEEGVDEPDIVKTDGSTIFAVARGK